MIRVISTHSERFSVYEFIKFIAVEAALRAAKDDPVYATLLTLDITIELGRAMAETQASLREVAGGVDAANVKLDGLDARFEQELRAAKAAVDEVLTVRQRAAFRFFEQDMEVQKVEYLTRARQPGRE